MKEPTLDAWTPAKLFRSTGVAGQTKQVGGAMKEGALRDMIQFAINDESELWRYSIVTLGRPLITAEQIRELADTWGIKVK